MSILTGPQIREEVSWGGIKAEPYNEAKVQPNSLDVTLGKGVCVYAAVVGIAGLSEREIPAAPSLEVSRRLYCVHDGVLDSRKKNPVLRFTMDESGWIVRPGIMYLMHINEKLHSPNRVMALGGKSSVARLSIIVHYTAGHAETGFNGQYTLEISATHPVIIYPGMGIGQVLFFTTYGQIEDYQKKGHYVGDAALGAEPSHSWEQFDAR